MTLQEFLRAPKTVQDAFMRRVRASTEQRRALEEYERLERIEDPGRYEGAPRWDESWRNRVRLARAIERGVAGGIEAERAALLSIPAPSYFTQLTGQEVPQHGGLVNCPNAENHANGDRTPSCKVYSGNGWVCFGCGEKGGIYQLGSLVYGLKTRGPEFRELHSRLCDAFGVAEGEGRAAA